MAGDGTLAHYTVHPPGTEGEHGSGIDPQQIPQMEPQQGYQMHPQQGSYMDPQQNPHMEAQQGFPMNPQQSPHMNPHQSAHVNPHQSPHMNPHQSSHMDPQQRSYTDPHQSSHMDPQQRSYTDPHQSSYMAPQPRPYMAPHQIAHQNPHQHPLMNPQPTVSGPGLAGLAALSQYGMEGGSDAAEPAEVYLNPQPPAPVENIQVSELWGEVPVFVTGEIFHKSQILAVYFTKLQIFLTHWGPNKMSAILQTSSNAFSWEKKQTILFVRLKLSLKFVPKGPLQLIISQYWFIEWLGPPKFHKPSPELMMTEFYDATWHH